MTDIRGAFTMCQGAPDFINVYLSCERCDLHGKEAIIFPLLRVVPRPGTETYVCTAGLLTGIGFAGILTFGAFVSRYLRYRSWWWGLHLVAQALLQQLFLCTSQPPLSLIVRWLLVR